MSRTTGDLTTPLGRTVTAAEAAAIRWLILRALVRAWGLTLLRYAFLAGLFAMPLLLDLWFGDEPEWQQTIAFQAILAALFGSIALYQARRLLALRDLETLPVHRVVSALHNGYARLFTPKAYRSEYLSSSSYELHPLPGRDLIPAFVWQLDLVRVRHGGPEQYFVLDSVPLRSAIEEWMQVEAYLWEIGVYQHPEDGE